MNIKYDKILYFKIERFLTYNSIHIWKVLLKRFPTICAVCQKLQNRSVIPKSYLNANIFRSTIAKELEKSFF